MHLNFLKLLKSGLIVMAIVLGIPTLCTAQTKAQQLKKIMSAYHTYNSFDGAVLVAENGKIIYKDAFGMANREWNVANATDTKFMIGSISKPFTTTLALIYAQKGLLDINKTVYEYLPQFKNKPSAKATIKQLMSNTSGLPNYDIIKDFFPRISRTNYTREDYIKIYCDSPLIAKPGEKNYYSSWGFFTLGCIIEKVSGKTYEQAMKEEIFDKIGMKNSGSYFHTKIVPRRAQGYDYDIGFYTSGDFRDQSNTMGTGDIYSTVEDIYKFHMAIANNTILNKQLTEEMLTPGMRPAQYGYGWFNQNFRFTDNDSVTVNYHLGSTDGFVSFFLRIPETNSMTVILCNSAPVDYFGITRNLLRVLYNKPADLRKPVHKLMEATIAKEGAVKAVENYKNYKADSATYNIDWLQLYYMAENLVRLKRLDDARIIAENTAKEFPKIGYAHLSLANIYLALNRKEDAVVYYKKTLEVNPNMEEAKNRLTELVK